MSALNTDKQFSITSKTRCYVNKNTKGKLEWVFFDMEKKCKCELDLNAFEFEINAFLSNGCYKCFNYEKHCLDKR